MADWIASNGEFFPLLHPDETVVKDRKERAAAAFAKLSLPEYWSASAKPDFMARFGFDANDVQRAAAEIAGNSDMPGMMIIEAPMGVGKTEAALAAAEILAARFGRRGVFFALPTQATSDGIWGRMMEWFERLGAPLSVGLVHGKAQFNSKYEPFLKGSADVDRKEGAFVHAWFKGGKKSMLSDFVVGTIDQLLFAALKQKHAMLRHLGFANKVVIIDECHAYDAYMNQYLDMAVRWLGKYGVPIVVLSATLPSARRRALAEAYSGSAAELEDSRAYPAITWVDGNSARLVSDFEPMDQKKVGIELMDDGASIVEKLEALLHDGGCAGVIANTVGRAQETFRELKAQFGGDVVLLHSRFITPDRIEKEEELLRMLGKKGNRPARLIVVGTQVLEQSLDIDFDVMFSDLCPMDLLLQRIGRMRRHKGRIRPFLLAEAKCFVTNLDDDASKKIYGEYILERTKARLARSISLPGDIAALVQDVYDESDASEADAKAREAWFKSIEEKKERAKAFRIGKPLESRYASIEGWLNTAVSSSSDKAAEATVRDTDETIEVIVVQEIGGKFFCGGREIAAGRIPGDEDAMWIARQTVRLPPALSSEWTINKTIESLEKSCIMKLPEWQKSPWLEGELFLILNEDMSAELCGFKVWYGKEEGLCYERVQSDS
jgi:CRISPR-associated endonuclease/helicase Cas3